MTESWWRDPLGSLVDGRRVIVAGGPAAVWTLLVPTLRELGASDVLVVGTDGPGAGPQPEARTVLVAPTESDDMMTVIRAGLAALASPPPHVLAAIEEFDPDRTATVFGTFLTDVPELAGRPFVAHRRPEWIALEDKTLVDDLLDRAGVARAESIVVPVDQASDVWPSLDVGDGTVWAADARDGFHGGASRTRWVADAAEAEAATAELRAHCDRVRIMPFLDGIATSVHGLVLPDGVVALRPVELVTLRRGHDLRYAGCATFWDPPTAVRDEMREAARRLGEQLRTEVDFRGAFTLDGVATADGFRPTELNPRFGAGLLAITRGLAGVPLPFVLDLVVAGVALPIAAADLESRILELADESRTGGTSQAGVDTAIAFESRPVRYADGEWRWAAPDETADGDVTAGQRFARLSFEPARTPIGASVGQRAVDFWRFADAELGTGIGPLTAPPDRSRSSLES